MNTGPTAQSSGIAAICASTSARCTAVGCGAGITGPGPDGLGACSATPRLAVSGEAGWRPPEQPAVTITVSRSAPARRRSAGAVRRAIVSGRVVDAPGAAAVLDHSVVQGPPVTRLP